MHGGPLKDRHHVAYAAYQYSFHEGDLAVIGIGRYYEDEIEPNWTFTHLGDPASPIARRLPDFAKQLGVDTILAPSPVAFNGKIMLSSDALTTQYDLAQGVRVLRNADLPADGILIRPGEIVARSTAGCADLIGWTEDPQTRAIVSTGSAHMGLKSAQNHVCRNLLEALGGPPEHAYFRIEFAIDPSTFIHEWDRPEDGAQNRLLCESVRDEFGPEATPGWGTPEQKLGKISLPAIARSELGRSGVPAFHVQVGRLISTGEIFYNTRDKSGKRNLTLVARFN